MEIAIISGGDINFEFLKNYFEEHRNQIIIAVDKGLESLYKLNIIPNHVVGDLDSVSINILNYYKGNNEIEVHEYIPEKDFTDTDIALNLAISLKPSNITILGALGKRMDHALANIHILKHSLEANIPCQILDINNKIYLIDSFLELKKTKLYGKYISLIPLTSLVTGLTLTGFKYCVKDFTLSIRKKLGSK